MYNEPQYDEEHLRLKRKDEREEGGAFGWMFLPAVLGMVTAVFLTIILPSLLDSISKQYRFDRIGSEILDSLNEEFALLAAMQWGETLIWVYLLVGAAAGIILRHAFNDEKM